MLAWWATLGAGLGLMLLAGMLLWSGRSGGREAAELEAELKRFAPVIIQLSADKPVAPETVTALEASSLGPLIRAMSDAAQQRGGALKAYQAQIEAAGLGQGLTPSNLVSPAARVGTQQKLADVRTALEALVAIDAKTQKDLDTAVAAWLQTKPQWGDPARRQALLDTFRSVTQPMHAFFEVERDIVGQVEGLLQYLERLGDGVSLEVSPQPELVFARADDLTYYRQTLSRLTELGQREHTLLMEAQKASGLYAGRVGELFLASATKDE